MSIVYVQLEEKALLTANLLPEISKLTDPVLAALNYLEL